MRNRTPRWLFATLMVAGTIFASAARAADSIPAQRPNILWIVVDDMSPHFGCYGEKRIATPHVDRLAREGTRFSRAFTTAPVCSPCRSALITGCYQTTIGAHHHRSGRGAIKIQLPVEVVPVPVLFRQAGYFTCIGGPLAKGKGLGKTDYNFEWSAAMYDSHDWSGRAPGQPFFMQVQLHGGKYRGQKHNPKWQERVQQEFGESVDPNTVALPPYYPRDPVLLRDWADYLDCCRYTDKEVGDVLARLEADKLLDSTLVIFTTDHGISHARGKQFLYDEGTHVPLVVRGPGVAPGVVRDDPVELIDLAAMSLAAAGITVPSWMQGRDNLSHTYVPRDATFAARDRCDETMERLRSVRTARFKYIRNHHPHRPHLQPCAYKDAKSIVQTLRDLHAAGTLPELSERLLFAETRPVEELYDLESDPFETRNLAADPAHATTLSALRQRLADWESHTGDRGRQPESPEMYDSDMAEYLKGESGLPSQASETLRRNIARNKAWLAEGK